MSECTLEQDGQDLLDFEKTSEVSYPSHSHEHTANTKMDSVKTLLVDKHPPNGMTYISSDANGLICQKKDSSQLFEAVTVDPSIVNPLQGECNSVDGDEHMCTCDKSGNEDICRMSSGLQGMTVQDDETEGRDVLNGIEYVVYESELQMPDIMRLITKDLSEPYSIYTYRYFIHNWPKLCFLAMDGEKCVGAVVCKLDLHKKMVRRGYIAMLAVDSEYRRMKIGSHLVLKAIKAMIADDCDEVVLETEITNQAALRLYENLGFVRDKRLFRYYLNGVDALRLKLWLR